MDISGGTTAHHCHIARLELDLGTEASDVARVAAAGRSLLLGFSHGHVVHFEWGSTAGPVESLLRRSTWSLPSVAGPSSVLTAAAPEGGPSFFAGTRNGWIFRLAEPLQQGQAAEILRICGAPDHEGSAVSALLLASAATAERLQSAAGDVLFSADSSGRVFRSWLGSSVSSTGNAGGDIAGSNGVSVAEVPGELFADLRSPVLALELCERTGRLLVSTSERIAIFDAALLPGKGPAQIRWVGSKPHKGQFTATFSRTFGPEALIAARAGGRLWVAEGATGTVQTTLKFQSAAEDKAPLNRLVALECGKVVSWERSEAVSGSPEAGSTTGCSVVLLDLDAIAVCREWSLAQVVDVARWMSSRLVIAHRDSVSVLLLCESPIALLRTLLYRSRPRLHRDPAFLQSCLEEANAMRASISVSAAEMLECLRPLIDVVAGLSAEGPDSGGAAAGPFKHWVTELEDREADDLRGFTDPALSLAVSPLANFPSAEGFPSSTAITSSSSMRRCRTREVVILAVPEDPSWVFGGDSPAGRRPPAGQECITPELLRDCHNAAAAATAAAAAAAAASVTVTSAPAGIGARGLVGPEPDGAVLRLLAITPFKTDAMVLVYFASVLDWVVQVLEAVASEVGPASFVPVNAAVPASHVFELLCLHAATASGSDCYAVSAWPSLGFAAEEEEKLSERLGMSDLAKDLRLIATAASDAAQQLEAVEGTDLAAEASEGRGKLWKLCKVHWTPGFAFSFCELFFIDNASVPKLAMERCLLRANGMAASGQGWLAVVSQLQQCLAHNEQRGTDAVLDLDAARRHLESITGGEDPSGGTAMLHCCIQDLIATAGEFEVATVDTSRVHGAFELALAHFPKVLPWNMDFWVRKRLGDAQSLSSTKGFHRAASRERYVGAPLPELLSGELLQYLLRLLPTCVRWPGFSELVQGALAVALHGPCHAVRPVRLYRARDVVADGLIDRHGTLLSPDLLRHLRYPLGMLRLLQQSSGGNAVASVDVSAQGSEAAVTEVIDILRDAGADEQHAWTGESHAASRNSGSCPVCAPRGHTCARLAALVRAEAAAVAGKSGDGGVSNDRTAIRSGGLDSGSLPCTTCGDLELARELKSLCGTSAAQWQRLVSRVSDAVTASSLAEKAPWCPPLPLERLLAAFAALQPGPAVASACLHAACAGALSDAGAAASADLLWASLKGLREAAAVLPAPRPAPGPPSMESRRAQARKATMQRMAAAARAAAEAEAAEIAAAAAKAEEAAKARKEGFFQGISDYVEISADGLYVRHRDETGEVMHGVVLGAAPLELVDRTCLYYELELTEIRSEEMPDGLTVGVTATVPTAIQEIPETAEHIPQTWAVGYDGQLWDAATGGLSRVDWDPRSLAAGDVVGVLVTASEGELLVFHNGVACCPGPRGIPVGAMPLYPVVDLLGAAQAVRWRAGARPPIGTH